MNDQTFEFTLSDQYKTIAAQYLGETDTVRKKCLEQMIDWINKHPYIQSCRTDSKFLLAFLRKNKFKVPSTQKLLESYLKHRALHPTWYENLSVKDPDIADLIDNGYCLPLGRDKNGRHYALYRFSTIDPNNFTVEKMMRTMSLVMHAILHNEEVQVGAFTIIMDFEKLTWAHAKMCSVSEMAELLKTNKVCPLRVKHLFMVNMPSIIQSVAEIMDPIASRLFNMERRQYFRNWDELKQEVEERLLPKELGGTVPMADLIQNFKKLSRDYEHYIESCPAIIYNRPNDSKCEKDSVSEQVYGSFRKLDID